MVSCASHGEVGIDSTKASVCIWDVDTQELIHRI